MSHSTVALCPPRYSSICDAPCPSNCTYFLVFPQPRTRTPFFAAIVTLPAGKKSLLSLEIRGRSAGGGARDGAIAVLPAIRHRKASRTMLSVGRVTWPRASLSFMCACTRYDYGLALPRHRLHKYRAALPLMGSIQNIRSNKHFRSRGHACKENGVTMDKSLLPLMGSGDSWELPRAPGVAVIS